MNKIIKLGLVSLLALPIVGCAKQQEKLVSENKENTTETTKETAEQKSIYGNKSEDYYIFHQDKYDTIHLRGMGKGYGATRARTDSGEYDISIKVPSNYYMHVTSIRENDAKEFVRWNDVMDKVLENSPLAEGKNRATVEDIENNEHVWEIYAGMRAENSNSNLADILMAHLTYSTENYEEKDAKNNFLVDPKKSDVSELDYHGYKLKVVPVKTTDGVPTGVHVFMYLDDHTCLWVKYEPETENIKNLNKEELVKLATKVLDELVTIKKK